MSSEGMSTSRQKRGGGTFNYSVSVVLKFDDVSNKLTDLRKKLNADYRAANKSSMLDLKFKRGMASIATTLDNNWKRTIGKDLWDIMKINTTEMQTDMKAISRVDTGLMRRSIRGRTTKENGAYVSTVGWLDLWHKYFGFQEEGTKYIHPMMSLNYTLDVGSRRLRFVLNEFTKELSANELKGR